MGLKRLDNVAVVVDDLDAAIAFFGALGLEAQGRGQVGGDVVERIIALDDVQVEFAFVATPDGHSQLELIRFLTPPMAPGDARAPANAAGIRHLCFAVDDLDATLAALETHGGALVGEVVSYGTSYRLCYLRGPSGIIIELAEKIGAASGS